MYIFTRVGTIDHTKLLDGTVAAVEVATLVTAITGVEVSVFSHRFGEPSNTITWSCRAESHAELQAMTDTLMADAKYLEWIGSHTDLFSTAVTDRLASVVSSSLTAEPKRFYVVLSAAAAPGKLLDAMEFGVRGQQHVTKGTGLSNAFLASAYGPFGTVAWLTGADTMAEVDALWAYQSTDVGYQALVKEAAPLFSDGTGVTSLIERLN